MSMISCAIVGSSASEWHRGRAARFERKLSRAVLFIKER